MTALSTAEQITADQASLNKTIGSKAGHRPGLDRLLLLGTNHNFVAPTRLGALSSLEDCARKLSGLKEQGLIRGFVLLLTCNRYEFYLERAESTELWELEQHVPFFADIESFTKVAEAAALHLIRVAGSLDSMVIGENQILGQVRHAWQLSTDSSWSSGLLDDVFRQAVQGAREIRNATGLGTRPVSVASLATRQLFQWMKPLLEQRRPRIALVGAGEMIRKAAPALTEIIEADFVFVNRTRGKAQMLAEQFHGDSLDLGDFINNPPKLDAIVIAVRSENCLIDKALIERMASSRNGADGPIAIIDLGVPACTDKSLAEDPRLRLLGMDELKKLSEENSEARKDAARRAEPIAERHLLLLQQQLKARTMNLAAVRDAHVQLAEKELDKLFAKELSKISMADRDRLREKVLLLAKAHAHLHLKDLKANASVT